MNAPTSAPNISPIFGGDTRLTMADLILLIWSRRRIFIATLILTVAAIVAWAFLATPTYRVVAKVMPRQGEDSGTAVQSLLAQLGGLASLAGIGIGASVDEQEAIAWLKSRALAERFIERKKLLPVLFSDAWDEERGQWRTDLKRVPTMDDAWLLFDRNIRRVHQDTKTRIVTLEVLWKDRQQAAAWANELIKQANEELRQRALQEADASLESLRAQLEQTDSVELRQSIYKLMEAQVNRKVLAKARPEYAFAVLDPAVVPDEDKFASPRRMLLLFVSIPLGLFVASSVVVVLHFGSWLMRKREQKGPDSYNLENVGPGGNR